MTPRQGLARLLQAHGIACAEEGEHLRAGDVIVGAEIVRELQHPDSLLVQLDVRAWKDGEGPVLESFAGVGTTKQAAIGNALANFATNALHVFLSALWDQPHHDQVSLEQWTLGQETWRAHIGAWGMRVTPPDEARPPAGVIDLLREAIEDDVPTGRMSWFRCYRAEIPDGAEDFEALRNNEPWLEGEAVLRALDWPTASEGFWSARLFMMLTRID